MKPLPAQNSVVGKTAEKPMPSIPTTLAGTTMLYSAANRRATACPVQRVYPWLLFTSTAIAGVFCLMYITKPVVLGASGNFESQSQSPSAVLAKTVELTASKPDSLLPDQHRLPGEKTLIPVTPRPAASAGELPQPSASAEFEQTNLRVQHILTADTSDGHVANIDIDVPVLYQSRNLRWTPAEVAQARQLLIQLADYQDKTRQLRSEGVNLLASWNQLVEKSMPAGVLRADSPSLPSNQQDAADAPRPAGLDTNEAIRIQPIEK